MRLPNTIASKYAKNALGDDPLSSAAKSWSTDSMNIGDAHLRRCSKASKD
jgi:hypothetical protein